MSLIAKKGLFYSSLMSILLTFALPSAALAAATSCNDLFSIKSLPTSQNETALIQSLYKPLDEAQAKFEKYVQHDPTVANQIAEISKKIEDLRIELTANPHSSEAKLVELTYYIAKRLRLYGFKIVMYDKTPSFVIDKLPIGHPLEKIFNASTTNSLQVIYIFDTASFIKYGSGGYQSRNAIFLSDFFYGRVNRHNLLHELGHRSEDLKKVRQPLSLANTSVYTLKSDEAARFLKINGNLYDEYLNYDELNRYRRDLKLLYSKSQKIESGGVMKNDFLHESSYKKSILKKISEVMISQSSYVIEALERHDTLNLKVYEDRAEVWVYDANAEPIVYFKFALTPSAEYSKKTMSEKFFAMTNEKPITDQTRIRAAMDQIRALAESNRLEAQSTLAYISSLNSN